MSAKITSRNVDLACALDHEPFYGDETDVSLLSDKIVRAAKPYAHCHLCHGAIAAGERHRIRTERNNEDKKVMAFRFCQKCTRAQAMDGQNGDWEGRLVESRYRIGYRMRAEAGQ